METQRPLSLSSPEKSTRRRSTGSLRRDHRSQHAALWREAQGNHPPRVHDAGRRPDRTSLRTITGKSWLSGMRTGRPGLSLRSRRPNCYDRSPKDRSMLGMCGREVVECSRFARGRLGTFPPPWTRGTPRAQGRTRCVAAPTAHKTLNGTDALSAKKA
jgi:hypothetical protein